MAGAVVRGLRPPEELLARLRWLFLVFGLFFVVTFLPQFASSPRPVALRVAASVALVALGVWWVRGYRSGHFPRWGLLLEAAAFLLTGLAPDDAFKALGLLYISVNFRAFYGSVRQVIAYTGLAIGCFLAVILVAPVLGGQDRLPQFWQTVPGVPVLALIAHLVAVACERSERAAARERALSASGLALAAAEDETAVRGAALTAVRSLLAAVPGVGVSFRAGGDEEPDPPGHRRELPLGAGGTSLVVTTPDPLPQEALDSLDALRMQVAFRLEAVALTRQLRHQALHDVLTGLPNRMHLDVELSRRLAADPEHTHVLLLDLDGFKPVNDVHGHASGDELLRIIGRRLVACVGARGFVARLGGDEFVVVVQGLAVDADSAAAEIVAAVARPVDLPTATVTVGTSVGVAHGASGAEVSRLLKEADVAMYAAKAAGRGRVAVSATAS